MIKKSQMFFALVYYPKISDMGFHCFRKKYEPFSHLLAEHIPFIYPIPGTVDVENLVDHIQRILERWDPFRVHIKGHEKTWDHWLILTIAEGNEKVIQLHDRLYTGILTTYLRKDLPFIPHIGVGLFSNEDYDFHNPKAPLSLNEEKYINAMGELEDLKLDFWFLIDNLTLIKINSTFTSCEDITNFKIT